MGEALYPCFFHSPVSNPDNFCFSDVKYIQLTTLTWRKLKNSIHGHLLAVVYLGGSLGHGPFGKKKIFSP